MQTPLALDLAGTFVFAISGAMAGVKHRLDLFGVLVLSFVAANTGGIARDVLIGAVPPPALSNWRYVAVSLLAVTFFVMAPLIGCTAPYSCSTPPGWHSLPSPARRRPSR